MDVSLQILDPGNRVVIGEMRAPRSTVSGAHVESDASEAANTMPNAYKTKASPVLDTGLAHSCSQSSVV